MSIYDMSIIYIILCTELRRYGAQCHIFHLSHLRQLWRFSRISTYFQCDTWILQFDACHFYGIIFSDESPLANIWFFSKHPTRDTSDILTKFSLNWNSFVLVSRLVLFRTHHPIINSSFLAEQFQVSAAVLYISVQPFMGCYLLLYGLRILKLVQLCTSALNSNKKVPENITKAVRESLPEASSLKLLALKYRRFNFVRYRFTPYS